MSPILFSANVGNLDVTSERALRELGTRLMMTPCGDVISEDQCGALHIGTVRTVPINKLPE